MNKELLTINEVCHFTTLSKASVYREIRKGNLPKSIKITDGRVAWLMSEIVNSTFYKTVLDSTHR